MADFLKLGDIKGEFASKAVIHSDYLPEKAVAQPEGFVIPTDGDDIVIDGLDRMANAYVDGAIGGFQSDALTSGGREGYWDWSSEPTPYDQTNGGLEDSPVRGGGASTFNADALVKQVNGTIGYEMQPDEYFSHNPEWFAPGSTVDSLTGEGRPTKIWTNGGASTFEDSNKFLDVGSCGIDLKSDADLNDAVFGMRQNIDWTAANGGPGSSYLTAKNASKSNAYVNEDDDSFPGRHGIDRSIKGTHVVCFEDIGSGDQDNNNLLIGVRENITGTAGAGGSTFMTGNLGCQTMPPMDNIGGQAGPGGTSYMTGQFDFPTNNLGGSASPGGDDI